MKILIVNKFYPPKIGGIERVVQQHATFLHEDGHDVTVLCCQDRFSPKTLTDSHDGVRVIRMASLGTFLSMPVSPTFLIRLRHLAKQSDLVIFHEPFPLGTLAGLYMPGQIPSVVFWHSDIIRQKVLKRIVEFLQRKLCRQSARILTTSTNLAESSSVIGDFKQKLGVVPLSVPAPETGHVSGELTRPASLPDIPVPFALFLGRLCYYKGVDVLLRALSRFSEQDLELPVVIVGDGPLKEQVKAQLKAGKNRKIIFLPRFVDEEEKQWLLNNAAFLLFPSTEPSEAFGIMQLEAMRMGVPVINTSLPTGVPWVSVDGKTGVTIPPNEAEALAEAISRLNRNVEERDIMGLMARERVKELFEDSEVRKLLRSEINGVISGAKALRERE